ncbi:hypothetical protein MY9_4089 [Bacillus sp. JS]|nr:hypothetical protein MY9_4089 [Bacillus sp. JS]
MKRNSVKEELQLFSSAPLSLNENGKDCILGTNPFYVNVPF